MRSGELNRSGEQRKIAKLDGAERRILLERRSWVERIFGLEWIIGVEVLSGDFINSG